MAFQTVTLSGVSVRPAECGPVLQRDQDETLAELRHAVTPGVNDALLDRVAQSSQARAPSSAG